MDVIIRIRDIELNNMFYSAAIPLLPSGTCCLLFTQIVSFHISRTLLGLVIYMCMFIRVTINVHVHLQQQYSFLITWAYPQ